MPTMDNTTSSELTVKVGSGFLIRSALIAVLCLVLGLWGIWDYVVAIPNQTLQYQRAEVARQFNRAVEPILNGSTKTISKETAQGLRDAIISDLTIDRDAFSDLDQMGRGERADGEAAMLQHAGRHAGGRSLTDGAGDMDGPKAILWIPQFLEQLSHPVELECLLVVVDDTDSLVVRPIQQVAQHRGIGAWDRIRSR